MSENPYLRLVRSIMSSSGGQAHEILKSNLSLVDRELVEAMRGAARDLEAGGSTEVANQLRTIAAQLNVALDNPLDGLDPVAALALLNDLLRAALEDESRPGRLSPLLLANLRYMDEKFARFLSGWSEAAFGTQHPSQSLMVARALFTLGSRLQRLTSGDPEGNQECALACYEGVLRVHRREDLPRGWAGVQFNLGLLFSRRLRGRRAENLERAVECYRLASEVFTPEGDPDTWAGIRSSLGNAYSNRVEGDRAENLEQAIACHAEALAVYDLTLHPEQWARELNNLGAVYCKRVSGDRVGNLKFAADCFRDALRVRTRAAHPDKWAGTMINLGNCYRHLGEVRHGPTPKERGAYRDLAVECYRDALQVLSPDGDIVLWAGAMLNLGNAYLRRGMGERAENLELAIESWGEAARRLGPRVLPEEWAKLQNNLGNAYRLRVEGDRRENLRLSVEHHRLAVQARSADAHSWEFAECLFGLGLAYREAGLFTEAFDALDTAVRTYEELRRELVSGEAVRAKLAERWRDPYHALIGLCFEMAAREPAYNGAALDYLERSKARNLVEQLALADTYPEYVPPELAAELQSLRRQIADEQRRLEEWGEGEGEDLAAAGGARAGAGLAGLFLPDRSRLEDLRRRLGHVAAEAVAAAPGLRPDRRVEPVTLEQVRALLPDERSALVEWYVSDESFAAFVVTRQGESPSVWHAPPGACRALREWFVRYMTAYESERGRWRESLPARLAELAALLHVEELMARLPNDCDRLILVPHSFLHLLPLHALKRGGGCWADDFARGISYAPSCQLLGLIGEPGGSAFGRLRAVQNPSRAGIPPLTYADLEAQGIRHFFEDARVLAHGDATKSALLGADAGAGLQDADCIHFACHGFFRPEAPMRSGLVLADADLSLREIYSLPLRRCRLATLSACETGMSDVAHFEDEYVGLPGAFLYAGSRAVVCSLWVVNDLSTTLLMVKFYETLKELSARGRGDVATALLSAQQWLRELTRDDLLNFIERHQLGPAVAGRGETREADLQLSSESSGGRESKPFADPFHWAAFIAVGL